MLVDTIRVIAVVACLGTAAVLNAQNLTPEQEQALKQLEAVKEAQHQSGIYLNDKAIDEAAAEIRNLRGSAPFGIQGGGTTNAGLAGSRPQMLSPIQIQANLFKKLNANASTAQLAQKQLQETLNGLKTMQAEMLETMANGGTGLSNIDAETKDALAKLQAEIAGLEASLRDFEKAAGLTPLSSSAAPGGQGGSTGSATQSTPNTLPGQKGPKQPGPGGDKEKPAKPEVPLHELPAFWTTEGGVDLTYNYRGELISPKPPFTDDNFPVTATVANKAFEYFNKSGKRVFHGKSGWQPAK